MPSPAMTDVEIVMSTNNLSVTFFDTVGAKKVTKETPWDISPVRGRLGTLSQDPARFLKNLDKTSMDIRVEFDNKKMPSWRAFFIILYFPWDIFVS